MDWNWHYTLSIDDVEYTIDWLKVFYLFLIITLGRRWLTARAEIKRMKAVTTTLGSGPEPTPTFSVVGNENITLVGLTYENRRIPDIEVKSRALYLDGNYKRNLAKNSRLYNRGAGVFVDGKFVG
jgi:hypothetical protein